MSFSNLPFGPATASAFAETSRVFHIGANPARKILLHSKTYIKLQKNISGRQICDMKLRRQI